jgi:hypothetical protein
MSQTSGDKFVCLIIIVSTPIRNNITNTVTPWLISENNIQTMASVFNKPCDTNTVNCINSLNPNYRMKFLWALPQQQIVHKREAGYPHQD